MIKTRFYGISTPGKFDRLSKQIQRQFTLGEASWITKQEIVSTLTAIFRQCNSRNVVLIGHGLRHKLGNMRKLDFRPGSHANIIAYVDTQNLSNTIRGQVEYTNLRSLACQLGLHAIRSYEHNVYPKGRNYHNAGNNAHYTLEVFILLMIKEHAKFGWVCLTRLSVLNVIRLISAKIPQDHLDAIQALIETSNCREESDTLQRSVIIDAEDVSPILLLATARWKLIKQLNVADERVESAFEKFDVHAQQICGSDAYSAAICTMPLYFALVPYLYLNSSKRGATSGDTATAHLLREVDVGKSLGNFFDQY